MRNLGAVFILALTAGAFVASLVVVQCNSAEVGQWTGTILTFSFEVALYIGLGVGFAVFAIVFLVGALVEVLGRGPTWRCPNCGQLNGVEVYRCRRCSEARPYAP